MLSWNLIALVLVCNVGHRGRRRQTLQKLTVAQSQTLQHMDEKTEYNHSIYTSVRLPVFDCTHADKYHRYSSISLAYHDEMKFLAYIVYVTGINVDVSQLYYPTQIRLKIRFFTTTAAKVHVYISQY
jgi:hypothetical protein